MPTTVPRDPAARELFEEISRWPIYDPHSHIDAHRPAARNLDEVLGYHYYTELAHSAGMPAERVDSALTPQVRARHLAHHLNELDNTVQYSWLLSPHFFGMTCVAARIGRNLRARLDPLRSLSLPPSR